MRIIVKKAESGVYWGIADKSLGEIRVSGNSLEELKENLKKAVSKKIKKSKKEQVKDLTKWDYQMKKSF